MKTLRIHSTVFIQITRYRAKAAQSVAEQATTDHEQHHTLQREHCEDSAYVVYEKPSHSAKRKRNVLLLLQTDRAPYTLVRQNNERKPFGVFVWKR